ncbi:MAG: biotin transporter BioY [Treponema sp.]|jgi:biotin transport system substrate-specific component|nr:biotin transporter BioY [Treponema sp.]
MDEKFLQTESFETKTAPSAPAGAVVFTKRGTVTGLTVIALFAALIAAGTFISIPLPLSPVPIVLQNFFALLAGLVLGPAMGAAAVALYLIAGIIGAPVFAGATGGIVRIIGPTGGFLIGYLLAGLSAGLIAGFPGQEKKVPLWRIITAAFTGLLLVYLPGLVWLKISTGGTWAAALAGGFIPFIPGDLAKGVVAVVIAPRLRRAAADLLSR